MVARSSAVASRRRRLQHHSASHDSVIPADRMIAGRMMLAEPATMPPKFCRSRGDETQTSLTAKNANRAQRLGLRWVRGWGHTPLWEGGETSNIQLPTSNSQPHASVPVESGVSPVPLQPQSKTRWRELRQRANRAQRLGLRQSSGALFVVTALGKIYAPSKPPTTPPWRKSILKARTSAAILQRRRFDRPIGFDLPEAGKCLPFPKFQNFRQLK